MWLLWKNGEAEFFITTIFEIGQRGEAELHRLQIRLQDRLSDVIIRLRRILCKSYAPAKPSVKESSKNFLFNKILSMLRC